jgi:hypothetical protein
MEIKESKNDNFEKINKFKTIFPEWSKICSVAAELIVLAPAPPRNTASSCEQNFF